MKLSQASVLISASDWNTWQIPIDLCQSITWKRGSHGICISHSYQWFQLQEINERKPWSWTDTGDFRNLINCLFVFWFFFLNKIHFSKFSSWELVILYNYIYFYKKHAKWTLNKLFFFSESKSKDWCTIIIYWKYSVYFSLFDMKITSCKLHTSLKSQWKHQAKLFEATSQMMYLHYALYTLAYRIKTNRTPVLSNWKPVDDKWHQTLVLLCQ